VPQEILYIEFNTCMPTSVIWSMM